MKMNEDFLKSMKEAFDLLADFQAKLNASADDIELAARSMGTST